MIQDLLSAVDKHVLLETAAYATQLTGVEFQHHLLAKIRRVTSSESSNLKLLAEVSSSSTCAADVVAVTGILFCAPGNVFFKDEEEKKVSCGQR